MAVPPRLQDCGVCPQRATGYCSNYALEQSEHWWERQHWVFGRLESQPSGDNIGPNNPPRKHARPAVKLMLASAVQAIVKEVQSDELTDWRLNSAFRYLLLASLFSSSYGIYRCQAWICISKVAATSAHLLECCKHIFKPHPHLWLHTDQHCG